MTEKNAPRLFRDMTWPEIAEAAPSGLTVFVRTQAQPSVVLPRYTSLFGPT